MQPIAGPGPSQHDPHFQILPHHFLAPSSDVNMSRRRMYDAVIQELSVLPNGVRLASILAGSLVRCR